MTRVLVTGASGFVGRHVVDALTEAGLHVHAVARRPRAAMAGVTWHAADLLDPDDRLRAVAAAKAEALLHLAWHATPPDYWRHADNVRWLSASLDLVRAFVERGGTRVVGVGSCAEYDWSGGFCREMATPLNPDSLYGVAKSACGAVLDAYARETAFSFAWARLFLLFGPGDAASRLIPSLTTTLAAGQQAVCRAGTHERDYLYVKDAASALVALLRSPVQGAVNIASGSTVTLGRIAERVALRLDRAQHLTIEAGPERHRRVAADVRRLREDVGWHPQHEFDTALDRTIDWWAAHPAGL